MASLNRSQLARWARLTPFHPQWLLGDGADTLGWVSRAARGRVLDIGCGDRWIETHLPHHCEYIALDYPVTGRDMYGSRPNIFADAARLPFADMSFDTIVLLEVLEHLRHPAAALSEIARVLRPGGQLLLSMPFLYPIHDAPHDYQRYTLHGLRREVEHAGLMAADIQGSMNAAESGGLLLSLALGGIASEAVSRRHPALLFAPVLALAIVGTNLGSWFVSKIVPNWSAMTAGYRLRAVRR